MTSTSPSYSRRATLTQARPSACSGEGGGGDGQAERGEGEVFEAADRGGGASRVCGGGGGGVDGLCLGTGGVEGVSVGRNGNREELEGGGEVGGLRESKVTGGGKPGGVAGLGDLLSGAEGGEGEDEKKGK